jgi:hypothetical protein
LITSKTTWPLISPRDQANPTYYHSNVRFFETYAYAKMTILLSATLIKVWVPSLLNMTSILRTSLFISKTKTPTYNSPKLKHILKPLESSE